MPNYLKYSTSTQSQALKIGNYWIGTGEIKKGPTSVTDYWNGIVPPSGGYTIYGNKASGGPAIHVAANDTELISLTNIIGTQSFTTVEQCLSWFKTQSDKMVFNRECESIVTNGLVLNLDAGFAPSYPITGTTWYDLSGYGNNGTLTNGPTYNGATGASGATGTSGGGSIVFDGTNDVVTIGVGTNYPYPYHTYEVWVKTTGLAPGMTITGLIGLDYGRLMFIDDIGRVQYVQQSGPSTVHVNTNVTPTGINLYDNRFHQIVCLRNTTSADIYVDGVLQKTIDNGGNPSWDGLNTWSSMLARIGDNPNNSNYKLSGSIPITRIYNRGLSSAEVLQNYKAMFPRFLGTNIVTDGLRLITGWTSLAGLTTRTADSVMAPDGTMTATLFERVGTAPAGHAQVRQVFPTVDLLPSTAYSISFWAKRISLTQVLNFEFCDNPQQVITLTDNWDFYFFTLTTNATFPSGEFIDIGSTTTAAGSQIGEKYSIWKLHVSLI
jgi:hypothetical protein